MVQKIYSTLLLFVGILTVSTAQITVNDDTIMAGDTVTWTADNVYELDGFVFVDSTAVLNIEAGTVIRGKAQPSTGDNASALIIARGAKIYANGTESEPIIFTAENDDLNSGTDLGKDDRGLWGGLIVLGEAVIARPGGEDGIEGIPASELRARFGGNNDSDDSGVLRYVSIRHGGAELSPGDEINGLTLGGVGSGTTVEYVEVFANDDDGIEFFGGTVGVKYASVAFCSDDSFDWDFGFRGKGQYWFSIHDQGPLSAGRGGELDGANPDGQAPFSSPIVYNATFIGAGTTLSANDLPDGEGNDIGLFLRDNTGGQIWNSIITEYPNIALAIEDRDDTDTDDAWARFQAGDLALANNIWFGFGVGNDPANFATLSDDATPLADDKTLVSMLTGALGNEVADPDLGGISRMPNGMLDPRPNGSSAALLNDQFPTDEYFDQVTYRGAFSNSGNWALNWTALSDYGYFGNLATPQTGATITIKDSDLVGGQEYNWTKNNTYILDGFVFLEAGACLNIQAGTVIKGKASVTTGDNASALIIARDAQIKALGTAAEPIIFTSENDDVMNSSDVGKDDRGLWGGVIILGNAQIARPGGEDGIEGIPAGEARARFGGNDDTDNSGTLRYVSIRHGGAELSPGDEINGLTLGGVGNGTTIEYVEVFANDDDGIEFFGGTVGVKWATVAFCSDDSFDWDFGFRGKGQFWFSIHDQGPLSAGRGGELDGANPDGQAPFSSPVVYNATFIGAGANLSANDLPDGEGNDIGIFLRDNTGGQIWNSIITEYPNIGLAIEDRADTDTGDAWARFQAGDLALANNIWWSFGVGNDIANFVTLSNDATPIADDKDLVSRLAALGNEAGDPGIMSISRNPDMMLNPRVAVGSLATMNAADEPAGDNFYSDVSFRGAFGPENTEIWLAQWSALDQYGYLDVTVDVEDVVVEENGFSLAQVSPNPVADQATVQFTLPAATTVELSVANTQGQMVKTIMNKTRLPEGENIQNVDLSSLPTGTYYIVLSAENVLLTQKVIVQ